jgi:5,5'-dehydrodivanillate O-demethylase
MTGRSMDHVDVLFGEHRLPEGVGAADAIMAQDYVAVRGQGVIHDRTQERLGSSDAGIALLRRIIFRELDAIRAGKPTKRWTKIDAPLANPTPVTVA